MMKWTAVEHPAGLGTRKTGTIYARTGGVGAVDTDRRRLGSAFGRRSRNLLYVSRYLSQRSAE